MVEAALYVLTGSILYAGAHHLYLGTTRTSTQTHIPLAAMYLLLAGFVVTSALMLQSQDASAQLQLARFSMTLGILMWLALIWYVAYYTRTRRFLLLDLLTAAWVILLIRNTSSPHGLLIADVAPTELANVSRWWSAVEVTLLASLLFCLYAAWRMFRRADKQAALVLVCGLCVLVATSLADHLQNTPVLSTLYLPAFGFIGFLTANSLYCILLDYRKRRKTIPTPAVYKLTFNPEWTALDYKLSDLRSPSSPLEEPAVAETPPIDPATVADQVNCETRQGELRSKKRSPGGQGESPPGERRPPGAKGANETPRQETPMSKRRQSSLNIVSDNLIDIAVYATMALNRFKRGDAEAQVLEMLCKKIRTKAIKTRRMANSLSRPINWTPIKRFSSVSPVPAPPRRSGEQR